MSIYLVRHGETEWSLSGQHTGKTNIPLTENGRHAAARWRPVLAHEQFAAVLTSPMQRARDTCELAGLADHAEIDPDLMEWNYGDYEGITSTEIHRTFPGWQIFHDGAPGGENVTQIGERADRLIARVRSIKGNVALFSHGHMLRTLAVRWIDLPVAAGVHFALDTAALCILDDDRGVPVIKVWNFTLG